MCWGVQGGHVPEEVPAPLLPGYPSAGQREPGSHGVRNHAGMLRRLYICGAKIPTLLNGVELYDTIMQKCFVSLES